MNRKYGFVLLFIILAAALAYFCTIPFETSRTIAANSRTAYDLTPEQLNELEKKSDAGDSEAALTIFWYYAQAKDDQKTAVIWLKKKQSPWQ